MKKVKVTQIEITREQVRAARTEVQAFRSAGLTPENLLVQLADVHLPEDVDWNRERRQR